VLKELLIGRASRRIIWLVGCVSLFRFASRDFA
jgi:hypothetical protein